MLAQRMTVEVVSAGEHVVLTISNSKWTFHYTTALRLSAEMVGAARIAKRKAGDRSTTRAALGTLHDAEKGPDYGQPFTPGKVYPVAREIAKNVSARAEITQVVVKLGSNEAWMHYKSAQTIAQWLRMRAKESKRRAGDTVRHWSAV